jgi:hypothetical protein
MESDQSPIAILNGLLLIFLCLSACVTCLHLTLRDVRVIDQCGLHHRITRESGPLVDRRYAFEVWSDEHASYVAMQTGEHAAMLAMCEDAISQGGRR